MQCRKIIARSVMTDFNHMSNLRLLGSFEFERKPPQSHL